MDKSVLEKATQITMSVFSGGSCFALRWLLFTKLGHLCVNNTFLLFIFLTKQRNGIRARHLAPLKINVEHEWVTENIDVSRFIASVYVLLGRGRGTVWGFALLTIQVLSEAPDTHHGGLVVMTLRCETQGREIISWPLHFDGNEMYKCPCTMPWVVKINQESPTTTCLIFRLWFRHVSPETWILFLVRHLIVSSTIVSSVQLHLCSPQKEPSYSLFSQSHAFKFLKMLHFYWCGPALLLCGLCGHSFFHLFFFVLQLIGLGQVKTTQGQSFKCLLGTQSLSLARLVAKPAISD